MMDREDAFMLASSPFVLLIIIGAGMTLFYGLGWWTWLILGGAYMLYCENLVRLAMSGGE